MQNEDLDYHLDIKQSSSRKQRPKHWKRKFAQPEIFLNLQK